MVEEILVVSYCNNNKISYKQEYSGQSSTNIIRSRDLTALQESCYAKTVTKEFYILCLKKLKTQQVTFFIHTWPKLRVRICYTPHFNSTRNACKLFLQMFICMSTGDHTKAPDRHVFCMIRLLNDGYEW